MSRYEGRMGTAPIRVGSKGGLGRSVQTLLPTTWIEWDLGRLSVPDQG